MLDIDQDALGQQGTCIVKDNNFRIYKKELEDGSIAVGLFNLANTVATITAKWPDLEINGSHDVRDLWRQKDLGKFANEFSMPVAPHSAELMKISN